MNVIVYVEGASDIAAMNELLRPLIEQKQQIGVKITFKSLGKGDGKKSVLIEVPKRAADIILNDPTAYVVAMPDLYPRNKAFPHETADELIVGIYIEFENWLSKKHPTDDDHRLKERFKVFCFKHDLEALVLAAEESLASRLGVPKIERNWIIPVEDQNQDDPPKRIVEALFVSNHDKYIETLDAPLILSSVDYQRIAERCPQQFKPFVDFLESVGASS